MARKQEDIYKEPIRDGNRGGLGLFKWESIKHDKDAEHYLGSSVKAAFGRWQNNKDLDWYHKEKSVGVSLERDEIAEMKRLEAEAMAEALGTGPFSASQGESVATGSNAQPPKHESSSFQDKVNFGFGRYAAFM